MTRTIGILIAWLPIGLVGLWFIYPIVRGWMALSDRPADLYVDMAASPADR